MRLLKLLIWLYFIRGLGNSQCLVADGTCFAEKSAVLLNAVAGHTDASFVESLNKLKESPFTMVVRYCLGREGDASSRGFVDCVASMSSCSPAWHSIINWQFCLCNTVHCVLKGCFQYWLETSDFTNTKCFAHCAPDAFSCVLRQTGKIPV